MFPEKDPKFAIVAGGTGGHIYPGIAIAQELKKRFANAQIIFIGSKEGLEVDLVPKANFEIKLINARALLRKMSYKSISAPFVCLVGFFQAFFLLKKFAPQGLISTGGYVSLPAVLAAKVLGIPIYLHEQNVLPGFTNQILARWARKVFLSFEESMHYLRDNPSKLYVTGNPVRQEILKIQRSQARQKLGVEEKDFVVLVMGGSQGAKSINQVIISSLTSIAKENKRDLKIFHIVGKRDDPWVREALRGKNFPFYCKIDYSYNIAELIAAADLVFSRAGATAIAEFLIVGLPMVLIPFPFSAENHQELNAKIIVAAQAGMQIADKEFTAEKFLEIIKNIDQGALRKMKRNCLKLSRPRAAEEIVNALF